MWESITALQAPVAGLVLLAAARVKLLARDGGTRGKAALESLLGARLAPAGYRLVGVAEVAIALLLLVTPLWTIGAIGAFGMSLGYLGYLRHAARTKPESGCGCLGSTAVAISSRTYTRAAGLGLLAALAASAPKSWSAVVTANPATATAIVLVELALFTAVSPEFDRVWRAIRARLSTQAPEENALPLRATLSRLQRAEVYRESSPWLHAEVTEHWDEGDWRFICYDAQYRSRDCTAVFAVPLPHNDTDLIKLAMVDESTGETLFSAANQPAAG